MTMQGYYTADGKDKLLEVPIDANWIEIKNMTVLTADGAGTLAKSEWQTGMAYGIKYLKTATTDALTIGSLAAGTAITPINTTETPLKAVNTGVTAVSIAATPIVSLASTTGIATGSIVRMRSVTGAPQLNGIDFTIGTVDPDTSFPLSFAAQLAVAGTTASLYPVMYQDIFYPRSRYISKMTKAAQAVVTMTVTHGFAVGDTVRLMVPDAFGMLEANLKEVKITAINTTNNTITVDLDTTSYTTFAFPAAAAAPLQQFAQVIPISGPVINGAFRGFSLPTGTDAPGGVADDVIHWKAGDSFNV